MNKKLVFRTLGLLMLVEALAMVPSFVVAMVYGDGDAAALGFTILIILACAAVPAGLKPKDTNLRAR